MLECVKSPLFVPLGVAPVKVSLSRWYISQSMVSERIDRQAHGLLKVFSNNYLPLIPIRHPLIFVMPDLTPARIFSSYTIPYYVTHQGRNLPPLRTPLASSGFSSASSVRDFVFTSPETAVEMTLYRYRVNHQGSPGQHNTGNTDVPEFVAKQLNLKPDPITKILRKNTSWVKGNVKSQPRQTC